LGVRQALQVRLITLQIFERYYLQANPNTRFPSINARYPDMIHLDATLSVPENHPSVSLGLSKACRVCAVQPDQTPYEKYDAATPQTKAAENISSLGGDYFFCICKGQGFCI